MPIKEESLQVVTPASLLKSGSLSREFAFKDNRTRSTPQRAHREFVPLTFVMILRALGCSTTGPIVFASGEKELTR